MEREKDSQGSMSRRAFISSVSTSKATKSNIAYTPRATQIRNGTRHVNQNKNAAQKNDSYKSVYPIKNIRKTNAAGRGVGSVS